MIKPERLKRGDKVAVLSLSRGMLGEDKFIHKYYLAKQRLENDYGLEVVAMPNALKGIDYLYRHPEARAQDLMDAFRDRSVKAVFNAIGGDDTIRLLPYIDFLQHKIEALDSRSAELSTAENRQRDQLRKALDECREYHDRLQVVAERAISFDLDDGVVVNYAKFGDVLGKIK